jgi:type II secretory pathway pseudopilin PulG
MIRFFRTLRQRLLAENRVSRYLLYAVGEIVLVMIGILLALQVNNWNQQREQQKTVNRFLASLVEDIKADTAQFRLASDQAIFRFHTGQQLLKWVGEPPVKLRPEEVIGPLTPENRIWNKPLPEEPDSLFLAQSFLWSIRTAHTVLSRATVSEMTGTGTFSYLKNKPLKDAINQYYNDIDWRYGEELVAQRQQIANDWSKSLKKSGVLAQDISNVEDPLGLLRNNPERIGNLRAIIRSAWFEGQSLEIMQAEALELIGLIETELEQ